MAALVALAGNGQPTRPADATVSDAPGRSIDDIDFAAVAQSGGTCAEGVQSGRPPLLVPMSDGASQLLDERSVARLEVGDDVLFADLDGDGGDEAVVSVVCRYGANGEQHTVQVWTLDGNRPVVAGRVTEAPETVAEASAFPPAVAGVAVEGDEVVVTFTTYGDDDPHCCPSQSTAVRYTFDGDALVAGDEPVTSP